LGCGAVPAARLARLLVTRRQWIVASGLNWPQAQV